MPKIDAVENKIFSVEGFRVVFVYQNGRGVRSDRPNIPQWGYQRAAWDEWTVSEWIGKRFKQQYPGFDVLVLYSNGTYAQGNVKLATVRATYGGRDASGGDPSSNPSDLNENWRSSVLR